MVVTVLKAFDIIYVSTRGDLETNLLAVKMLDEFSKYRNFGRSATVAVLIFVCVLPIIVGTAIRERENTQSWPVIPKNGTINLLQNWYW